MAVEPRCGMHKGTFNSMEFYSYVAVNSFEFVAHDIYVNIYSGMLSEVLW